MKFWDILWTANANMFRNKLRTILTILAIFIGAFALALTSGISAGISGYVNKQVSNLGQKDLLMITAKTTNGGVGGGSEPQKYQPGRLSGGGLGPMDSSGILTAKDISTLRTDTNLSDVQPAYSVNVDYIQGLNGDKYKITASPIGGSSTLDLAAGNQLASNASSAQVVLPISYVSVLGYASPEASIGQTTTLAVTDATGMQHTVTAEIAGVQQKGLVGGSGAVLNDTLTSQLYRQQTIGLPAASKDKYRYATARISGSLSSSRVTTVKSQLDSQGYTAQTTVDRLGAFKSVLSAVTWVLIAFAMIALLAAGFGIVNTLLMSVQERTKEIGLMKAMGMPNGRVFMLFSFEAILIGFWGSLLGIGAAVGVGQIANNLTASGILKDLPGFNLFSFPPLSLVGIVVLIMIIALLAGSLPARKAATQNPIDALRYE